MIKSGLKLLTVIFLFSLVSSYILPSGDVAASAGEREVLTYLVLGLDDAAENADIIMLVGCDTSDGSLTFLQVPRDTYCDYGGGQNKINGVFASYRNGGLSEKESLVSFTNDFSEIFGVRIDASFAVTVPAFLEFVESLGGVCGTMPHEYTFYDEHGNQGFTLTAGENRLSAKEAELFVRHRRGYSLGDLTRIDAQKIFLSGVVKSVLKESIPKLIKAAYSARDNFYANCKFGDFVKLLVKKPGRNQKIARRFVTLPGEAVMSQSGISYYSVNKKSAAELLSRYFVTEQFDSDKKLLFEADAAFYNIYYDENSHYREYTDENLGDIKLK